MSVCTNGEICLLTSSRQRWPEISSFGQAEHYNRDKVSLAELSVQVQNETSGLWELTGVIVEMRLDKLSYLVEIDGRMYVRGRSKIKPDFQFKVGVLDLEKEEVEVGPRKRGSRGGSLS